MGDILIKTFESTRSKPQTRFSIIIPFRNEATHLPALLKTLAEISYPTSLFEILLVNDESTDTSTTIVSQFIKDQKSIDITLLENNRISASPKKDAIQTAIHKAKGDWIITTDADCKTPVEWLETIDAFIQKKDVKMVVMPVAIAKNKSISFLKAYEQLDFLSLMGATTGSFGLGVPFLCNGANLAFEKTAFLHLNGYTSNNHLASGDDHFLLEDISRLSAGNVGYLRSQKVVVTTRAQSSWNDFISQRIRWASKAPAYTFWFSKFMGVLVFGINVLWSLLFITLLISYLLSFIDGGDVYAFAKAYIPLFIIVKLIVDAILIYKQSRFYKRSKYMFWYPIIMICYPFLSSYIAIASLVRGFEWKERTYGK